MTSIKQPSDKSHFILPDLGEGVHEAELIRWKVEPGQKVEEHQTLAEMETDKALVEVPSPWTGTVKELHGKAGDVIAVGSVLVSYDVKGGAAARGAAKAAAAAATESENGADSGGGGDAGTVVGSVDTGMVVPQSFLRRGTAAEQAATGKALATPAVRGVARELGVDINKVRGTGRGGRVTAADVQAYGASGAGGGSGAAPAARRPAELPPARPPVPVSGDGVAQRIPFRGVRRTIAEALTQSVRTAVHFTVTDEADVTTLDRLRREHSAALGRKLSFLPFVMTAACRALRLHPSVNANVDDQKAEILVKSVINLGIAVDTEHGLMVPVIAGADGLSLARMADAVADLAARCRDRTIERSALVGGTFTISNVGSYGGLHATPIINYPEVAIIAIGRVREQVLVREGMFYAGRVMPLSLSCDHRVVDGAEGARFLNTVRVLLEDPEGLVGNATG